MRLVTVVSVRPTRTKTGCVTTWTIALENWMNVVYAMVQAQCLNVVALRFPRPIVIATGTKLTPLVYVGDFVKLISMLTACAMTPTNVWAPTTHALCATVQVMFTHADARTFLKETVTAKAINLMRSDFVAGVVWLTMTWMVSVISSTTALVPMTSAASATVQG